MRRVLLLSTTAAAVLFFGGAAQGQAPGGDRVEVVVTLAQPRLAGRDTPSARTRVARAQAAFERRLHAAIPAATVRWRYRTVLDGLAVVVPAGDAARLRAFPGVRAVYPSVRYHQRLYQSPEVIGAPQIWGPDLASAGQGIKIGIIDEGVDQSQPFLSPQGFTMPPGFPKGQKAYTTAKVIVARAFAPAGDRDKYANAPFDPTQSFHATHVAGIAAGDYGTKATLGKQTYTLSGIAPRAWIGNYKALGVVTPDFGLDGNSPEIAAAIEAAVDDGMNVINLSLGEPEVNPGRDLVVKAIQGAAAAGVVPVVAAGNDYAQFGNGSIGSPGNAPAAISVAAASKQSVIADFSSAGPTPISLQLKPDVTAPGVNILSSVPASSGTWEVLSGTSMATPHVAGAAAILRQRHPSWTVAQIKSALVQTGLPVYTDATRRTEVSPAREGGGMINLPRADDPLLFADPAGISFGFVRPGATAERTIQLADAGGGAGAWNATSTDPLVTVSPTATVPGPLTLQVSVPADAADGGHGGFVDLRLGSETRRIPFWFRVETPHLAAPVRTLPGPGVYTGDTRRGHANVSAYRYPDNPSGSGVPTDLAGPEEVFRLRIDRTVANFGVVVLGGSKVEPRVVSADDESRLTGYPGLPVNLNPYLDWYGRLEPTAGAILPAPGSYYLVFDEPSATQAGPFRFRVWVNDTTPPKVRLLDRRIARGGRLRLSVTDAGAGVDPRTFVVKVDGSTAPSRLHGSVLTVIPSTKVRGYHRVVVRVSDYQESKNMEDVPRILPNTRTFSARFQVR